MSEPTDEYLLILTTDEAAAQVGVSPATIRKWVVRGHLEPLLRGAHPLRFFLLDVARCHRDRQPQSYFDQLARRAERWEAACAESGEVSQ